MDDKKVLDRIQEHMTEAIEVIGNEDKVIYTALQGSQNYNLAYKNSDVDSKTIILPTLREVVQFRKPVSTTHVRRNEEHIDLKDIRLMFDCFKKQNINFVEILFTDYYFCHSEYEDEIEELRANAEDIVRYNPYRAIKCIKGMAMEKYHALKHPYPSKKEVLEQFGYDPKQLHHIMRLYHFLTKYLADFSYRDCLYAHNREELIEVKKGLYDLAEAERKAELYVNMVSELADFACDYKYRNEANLKVEQLLEDIKYEIMTKAFKKELYV